VLTRGIYYSIIATIRHYYLVGPVRIPKATSSGIREGTVATELTTATFGKLDNTYNIDIVN